MAQIGSLSVKLGLVTVEWDKATDQAKRSAKDLQTSFDALGGKVKNLADKFKDFSGIGAVLGFGALYHEAVALTDEITDLSKSFGLSTGEILAFRDALEQSGGKADGADKALNALFGKIADARSGNDAAIAQFQQLGITFSDLQRLSPYEAIQKVASGFSNITNQFEKTKAIKEIFSKAGIGVDLDNVATALKKGTSEFNKYDDSIQKVGQVSDALKKNLTNLTLAFADLIAPLSQSHIVKIETFSAVLKGIAAGAAVAAIATMAVNFANLAIAINAAAAAGALFNATAGGATPIGLIIKAVTAAAAIGTFVYVTGSASNESGTSNAEFDKFAAEEERQRRIKAGQIPDKSPYVGKTANLGTLVGRSLEQHGQYMPEGSFTAPSTLEKKDDSVSNDVKAKQASINLTYQLIALEKQRNANQIDASKTELEKKLNDIQITKKEKLAQINAEEKQQLVSGGDKKTEELKAAIAMEASAKRAKADQEATAATAMANLQDRLRLNKDAIEAEKQLADITTQETEEAFNFYNDQVIEAQAKRVVLAKEALDAEEAIRQESEQTTAEAWSYVDAKTATQLAFHKEADEAQRLTSLTNERMFYENGLAMLSDKQRQKLLDEYDLNAGILDLKRQADKLGIDTTTESFQNFIDKLKATREKTLELKQDQQDFQRTFTYGWTKAFNEYADNAQNAALRAQDVFKSMTDTLNSAISEFVDKGTIAWDKLIDNMIKGMLKAELQRQASQLFSMGFSFLKAAVGGGPVSGVSLYDANPYIPGHATGGVASANTLSIVGERGPELFMPKTSGAVIPNNQLSSLGSGQTINYNGPYIASMSAIDTQSGVQFLSKNRQAVWATYQSANRSIPMSR